MTDYKMIFVGWCFLWTMLVVLFVGVVHHEEEKMRIECVEKTGSKECFK